MPKRKKKTCQTLLLLFTIDSYKCCVAMPCIFIFEQCILASCTRLPVAIPILFPRITDVRLTSSPVCPLSRMPGPHRSCKRVKIWNAHTECLVIRAIDWNGVCMGLGPKASTTDPAQYVTCPSHDDGGDDVRQGIYVPRLTQRICTASDSRDVPTAGRRHYPHHPLPLPRI